MRNAQSIHKIANANDIMHPDYRDTKLFLNLLILLDDNRVWLLFQIATVCKKKENLCKPGVVEGERMCVSSEVICVRLVH